MVAWFDDDANGSNDNEIHAVTSTDGGATFGPEINLTPTVGANAPATAHDFDLWVDGSSFYCAYTDDSAAIAGGGTSTINAGRLSLARSTDSGATFASVVVNTDPADVNQRPHMAAMANRVVIHSEIGTNGNNLLGYYTSLDGGASFGPVDMVMNAGPDVDSEDDNNGTAMAISPVTGTAISAFWDNNSPTALNEVFISGVRGAQMSLGTSYCGPAVPNSSGQPSSMEILGSPVAADNDMTLRAVSLPPTSFGFFVTSQMQGFVMNPGGSEGNLCLSGGIGRFVGPGQIQNSGQTGSFEIQIDLNQQPTPGGLVSVSAGETWNFQAWHRDAVGGMSTSNFSDGRSLVFQ